MRFAFVFRRRIPKRVQGSKPDKSLDRDIDSLFDIFIDVPCPVYLIGGVGTALWHGEFYREHKDFDLVILDSDIHKLAGFLETKGYRIYKRIFMTRITSGYKFEIYAKLPASFSFGSIYGKHLLHVIRKKRSFFADLHRLNFMDIRGCLLQGDQWKFYGPFPFVHKDNFMPGVKFKEDSGLLLSQQGYLQYMPIRRKYQLWDYEKYGIKSTPITFDEDLVAASRSNNKNQ